MTLRDTSKCPNPKGMTVEFGEEVVQAHAWRLKGVGAYGSDVDVISVELYRELAHKQQTTMEALTRWAESAHKNEKRATALAEAGDELTRLLQLAYNHSRPDDPERDCSMEMAPTGGHCWCRQVRAALEAWKASDDA